jgi:hypothetical protein
VALLVDPQQPATVRHRSGALAAARPAAEDRLNAQGQLARAERLGHIVVGAELEPGDPVTIVRTGREHECGHVGARPDLARDRFAGHVGQAQVENDEIGMRLGRDGDGPAPEPVESTARPSRSR